MRVRAIGIKGAGLFWSGGIDRIAQRCNRIKGCLATSHLYGLMFTYSNVPRLTAIAVSAIDSGEHVVLFGNSMGGDAVGRIVWNVKQQRPDYLFPFVYYIDPTPLVWNVESNVELAINPYNTRVIQFGGGRCRLQDGNGVTKIIHLPRSDFHTSMDDIISYHEDIERRIREIVS